MKTYRFFFHYYRQKKCMSVHFRGKCNVVKNIVCSVACETKYHNRQPYLTMQGMAHDVIIDNDTATII